MQRGQGATRLSEHAHCAHRLERRLLLLHGQPDVERLQQRRGRRREQGSSGRLRDPEHGPEIRVRRADGHRPPERVQGSDAQPRVQLELNKDDPDPTSRTWRRGDSASLAVGQGDLLVTPLQLANVYATFANGGTLNRPRIASSVREYGAGLPAGELGEEVNPIGPQKVRSTELSPLVRQPILMGSTASPTLATAPRGARSRATVTGA